MGRIKERLRTQIRALFSRLYIIVYDIRLVIVIEVNDINGLVKFTPLNWSWLTDKITPVIY